MKLFRRFALASTIGTYLVIFVGGLVRVSGAGLGCPDWPQCFGRWFPPTSLSQIPPEFDVSQFNLVLAWIEYVNRLLGMGLGLLIAATAVIAIVKFRHNKKVLWGAIGSAVLVALLGLQGGKVITSELQPLVVSIHMLLAQGLGSLLIFTTLFAYWDKSKPTAILPAKASRLTLILWLLGIVQVVLGTQVRSILESLAEKFPLLADSLWLKKVGPMNHIHMTLGVVLVLMTIFVGRKLLSEVGNLTPLLRNCVFGMIGLITIQILLGFSFLFVGMPELVRVFHLWTASLYIAAVFILFVHARYEKSMT